MSMRPLLSALLLACLCLAPRAGRAVPPTPAEEAEAKGFFTKGNAAYEAKRFAEALELYRKSFRKVPRPNVLYNIARSEEQLGDFEGAYLDYQRFIELADAGNRRLPDAKAKLAELVPKVRITVHVESTPPGAAVHVDGSPQAAGYTPVDIKVRTGRHTLRLAREHHAPVEVEVEAAIGKPGRAQAILPQLGVVELFSDPTDAEIRREGDPSGPAVGHYTAELPPGPHVFTITARGQPPATVEVLLKPGEKVSRRVRAGAEAARGTLLVRSPTPGATVFVDALPVGSTPEVRHAAAAGEHEVAVERPGMTPWRGRVRVDADRTTTVDVRLGGGRSSGARAAIWGLGGTGVASVVAGSVFGVLALSAKSDYEARPTTEGEDRTGQRALYADVLIGTGAAALVGALLVWRFSGTEAQPTAETSVAAR